MFRFAVEAWEDAYTSYYFLDPSKPYTEWDEWMFYFRQNLHDMMEEGNGFFMEWGIEWLGYYQLLFMCIFMLVGPCLMCYQSVQMYKRMQHGKECSHGGSGSSRPIEEDPDFEVDEDAEPFGAKEEEKKEEEEKTTDTGGKEKAE